MLEMSSPPRPPTLDQSSSCKSPSSPDSDLLFQKVQLPEVPEGGSLPINSREKDLAERAVKRAAKAKSNQIAADARQEEVRYFQTHTCRFQFTDRILLQGNVLLTQQDYYGASLCYIDAIKIRGPKSPYLTSLAAAYLKMGWYVFPNVPRIISC